MAHFRELPEDEGGITCMRSDVSLVNNSDFCRTNVSTYTVPDHTKLYLIVQNSYKLIQTHSNKVMLNRSHILFGQIYRVTPAQIF